MDDELEPIDNIIGDEEIGGNEDAPIGAVPDEDDDEDEDDVATDEI